MALTFCLLQWPNGLEGLDGLWVIEMALGLKVSREILGNKLKCLQLACHSLDYQNTDFAYSVLESKF